VPVIGYGVDELPAFYVRSSGLRLVLRADTPSEVAAICRAHWQLGLGGVVVAVPVPEADALPARFTESATGQALNEALRQLISGAATTPFVLKRMAELTAGATLVANLALLRNNAAAAAEIAVAMAE
jgi:pseudouridine-5'-phosphate glycosidase